MSFIGFDSVELVPSTEVAQLRKDLEAAQKMAESFKAKHKELLLDMRYIVENAGPDEAAWHDLYDLLVKNGVTPNLGRK